MSSGQSESLKGACIPSARASLACLTMRTNSHASLISPSPIFCAHFTSAGKDEEGLTGVAKASKEGNLQGAAKASHEEGKLFGAAAASHGILQGAAKEAYEEKVRVMAVPKPRPAARVSSLSHKMWIEATFLKSIESMTAVILRSPDLPASVCLCQFARYCYALMPRASRGC